MRGRVGRLRIDELHCERPQVAARDPAAEAEHREHPELDPLARHGPLAAAVAELEPPAVAVFGEREGGGVAHHVHRALEALQRCEERRPGDQLVTDDAELAVGVGELLREAERGFAGARDGELPEAADVVDVEAARRIVEDRAVEPRFREQRGDVDAFGREHLHHAAHPGGRTGQTHRSPSSPNAGVISQQRGALRPLPDRSSL